ncbi:MAG: amino acid permease [Verrucomicrobia bacterium]|nr:amino acid permease [Verrucomicrobiota bacterium]
MNKKISFFSLIMLVIAAIDSVRNLPSSALFGSSLIFFFIFAAIFFLFPTALVSAELSAAFPEKGGVYHWVRMAFGEKWAMLAIWLQWINTMVWYPSILSFIAGTAAYLVNPELANQKEYLVCFILILFWTLTFINLFGLRISVRINNICAMIGTIIPMLLLIGFGAAWIISGKPLQIAIDPIPQLNEATHWISLVSIMSCFLGMELAGVHVHDIRDPQKNYPRAMLISSLFILFSMLFGSLTIALVLPANQINLVSGVMQVFANFFSAFGINGGIPLLTLCVVIGTVGGLINWLISPAKGLLHAAEFGYLPPILAGKNRHGAPAAIIIGQALIVSLICLLFLFVPGVNAFYWFLTALSAELYMIMYILMFLSCLKLRSKFQDRPLAFKIPGKILGLWTTNLFGILGCAVTIIVSILPPDNINIGSHVRYVFMILIGNILTIAPITFFYLHKKKISRS